MAATDTAASATLVASGDILSRSVAGFGSVAFQLAGTFTATIAFESTIDGRTWTALSVSPSDGTTAVTSATAAGSWSASCAGAIAVRMRCTAYTSGVATASMRAVVGGGSGGSGTGGGGGPVTIADGADVTQGAIADAAVTGDNAGTGSAKLRGINKILADVWDSVNNRLKVVVQNTTLAVTQSGSWVLSAGSAIIGNVRIDQTTPGTTNGVQVNAALPGGTNNIGDVDVASIAAGTTLIGKVSAGIDTASIYDGTTALTPKFAVIDVASSGDNTIISAVNPKKLRVLGGMLIASAAVTVRFESGASGTALTGQMQLAANAGFAIPYAPIGHFETASNTLLNLELSGAVSVDGWLMYVEV